MIYYTFIDFRFYSPGGNRFWHTHDAIFIGEWHTIPPGMT